MSEAYPEFIIWTAQFIHSVTNLKWGACSVRFVPLWSYLYMVQQSMWNANCVPLVEVMSLCTQFLHVFQCFFGGLLFLAWLFHTIWLCSSCISHHLANPAIHHTSFGLHGTWSLCNCLTMIFAVAVRQSVNPSSDICSYICFWSNTFMHS